MRNFQFDFFKKSLKVECITRTLCTRLSTVAQRLWGSSSILHYSSTTPRRLRLLVHPPHKIGGNTNSLDTHSLQSKGHHQGFKNSLSAASTAVTMMQKDIGGSQKIILSSLCRIAVIVSSLLNNAPKKVCSWVYYPKEIKFFSDQTICCCYWEVVSAANCRWVPDTGLIRWSLFFTSGCESGYLINGLIVCYLFHLQSYLFLWWLVVSGFFDSVNVSRREQINPWQIIFRSL